MTEQTHQSGLWPVQGEGVLARQGSLVLLSGLDDYNLADMLLDLLVEVAGSGADGRHFADVIADALDIHASSASRSAAGAAGAAGGVGEIAEPGPPVVAFGPAGAGLAITVSGGAWAEVSTSHGMQRVAADVPGMLLRCVLRLPVQLIRAGLQPGDITEASTDRFSRLDGGTVRASGLAFYPGDLQRRSTDELSQLAWKGLGAGESAAAGGADLPAAAPGVPAGPAAGAGPDGGLAAEPGGRPAGKSRRKSAVSDTPAGPAPSAGEDGSGALADEAAAGDNAAAAQAAAQLAAADQAAAGPGPDQAAAGPGPGQAAPGTGPDQAGDAVAADQGPGAPPASGLMPAGLQPGGPLPARPAAAEGGAAPAVQVPGQDLAGEQPPGQQAGPPPGQQAGPPPGEQPPGQPFPGQQFPGPFPGEPVQAQQFPGPPPAGPDVPWQQEGAGAQWLPPADQGGFPFAPGQAGTAFPEPAPAAGASGGPGVPGPVAGAGEAAGGLAALGFPPAAQAPAGGPAQSFEPAQSFDAVLLVGGPAADGALDVGQRQPLPAAAEVLKDPSIVAPGPIIQGVYCKNGHFDDPEARYCAVCGISMNQQTLVPRPGPRPPLGVLVIDDGSVFQLEQDYVLGREPSLEASVAAGICRPLRIRDDSGIVSRVHARVHLDGWHVLVTDLGSANGTRLLLPDQGADSPLQPQVPTLLVPGSQIDLGGRGFRYESHRGR